MKMIFVALTILMLTGCATKKIIVKNCEKAGNADVFICDEP